jgi:hypothetical protein
MKLPIELIDIIILQTGNSYLVFYFEKFLSLSSKKILLKNISFANEVIKENFKILKFIYKYCNIKSINDNARTIKLLLLSPSDLVADLDLISTNTELINVIKSLGFNGLYYDISSISSKAILF